MLIFLESQRPNQLQILSHVIPFGCVLVVTRFCIGKKMPQNVVACESSRESYFRACFGWRTGTSSPYRYTMVIPCFIEAWLSPVFWGMLVGITRRSWDPHHAAKHTCCVIRANFLSRIIPWIVSRWHNITRSSNSVSYCAYILHTSHAPCRHQNTVTNSDNRPSDSEVDWSCSGWRLQGKFVVE